MRERAVSKQLARRRVISEGVIEEDAVGRLLHFRSLEGVNIYEVRSHWLKVEKERHAESASKQGRLDDGSHQL